MILKAVPGGIAYLVLFWTFSLEKSMKKKILDKLLRRTA
jgi:hypothetical protein